MCQVLNVSEFWIFSNFCKCHRVLNICGNAIMEKFWIFQDSKYASFCICKHCRRFWIWLNNAPWQDAEYAWSTFHMVLNNLPVLNMSGLRIWQGCEYARVTQGAECAWFVELGHFNKHFIENTCKRGLTEKLLEFFS